MANAAYANTIKGGVAVDVRDFKKLALALRKANRDLYLDTKRELRAVGQIVADEAKTIVSPYSSTIPPGIKVRTRGFSVSVEAGAASGGSALARDIFSASYGTRSSNRTLARKTNKAEGSPIAVLFELGNKRSRGGQTVGRRGGGVFRHPVYGNREVWVDQKMHPFLWPAYERKWPVVQERVLGVLDNAAHAIAYDFRA